MYKLHKRFDKYNLECFDSNPVIHLSLLLLSLYCCVFIISHFLKKYDAKNIWYMISHVFKIIKEEKTMQNLKKIFNTLIMVMCFLTANYLIILLHSCLFYGFFKIFSIYYGKLIVYLVRLGVPRKNLIQFLLVLCFIFIFLLVKNSANLMLYLIYNPSWFRKLKDKRFYYLIVIIFILSFLLLLNYYIAYSFTIITYAPELALINN